MVCRQPLQESDFPASLFGIVQKVFSEKASAIARMPQKCVKNASEMRQNCVKMGLVLLGKGERPKCVRNASKSRQKCVKMGLVFVQGRKRNPNPNFLVWIFSSGVGVFHVNGWGSKSSICPSKHRESNFLGGISRDLPGYPGGARKVLRKKSSCSISVPYLLGKEERPKCVRNASKLRQKCVKNAPEHLWGRTSFGRYRFVGRKRGRHPLFSMAGSFAECTKIAPEGPSRTKTLRRSRRM